MKCRKGDCMGNTKKGLFSFLTADGRAARKKEREEVEYRKKYLSEYDVDDPRFGKVHVQHDAKKKVSKSVLSNVLFDGQPVEVMISILDDYSDIRKAISNVSYLFGHSKIFKKKMYPELENFLKDYDTVDLGTNLIHISEEFLRQRFRFKMIRADEDKTIELWGNWEDSGEQDYAIRYEVETEKLSFEKL